MQQQGVVPNAITYSYSALISACEKGQQPERALQMFKEIMQQVWCQMPSSTMP